MCQSIVELLPEVLEDMASLIASGITNQVESFVFTKGILLVGHSRTLKNGGNAGHTGNRAELGERMQVFINRRDRVLQPPDLLRYESFSQPWHVFILLHTLTRGQLRRLTVQHPSRLLGATVVLALL